MPIEIIQTILSIEARASEIISSAERKKVLAINRAKEEASEMIAKAKEEGKKSISDMIEKARAEARDEKTEIERKCEEAILSVKTISGQKIAEAKKRCQ